VFIFGYPQGKKGWLLYDLETKKLIVSRDVLFYEAVFPCADPLSQQITPLESIYQHQQSKVFFPFVNELECVKGGPPSGLGPDMTVQTPSTESEVPCHASSSCLPGVSQGPDVPTQDRDEAREAMQITAIAQGPDSATASTRPLRARRPRTHLKDYIFHASQHPISLPLHESFSGTSHPLSHCISYERFSPQYRAFFAAIISKDEPKCFSQAIRYPKWREAMVAEISALENNQTWEFATLPPGKKTLGCKWFYKTKYHVDGSIERHKARLVVMGNNQVEGEDFHETFALVAKMDTVHCLLTVAASKGVETSSNGCA